MQTSDVERNAKRECRESLRKGSREIVTDLTRDSERERKKKKARDANE